MSDVKLAPGEKLLELRLDVVRLDGGTQSRAAINQEKVGEYGERLEQLPPVIVYFDGSHYWLASGFHRCLAHHKNKRKSITCIVRTGTVRDATLFSVSENAEHGLPRTREDNRHICRMLLTDDEWKEWSDREIAEKGKVGRWLVGEVRKELKEEGKARREKEAEEKRLAEEKAKQETAAKEQAEKDKIKDGWVAPGKKAEQQSADSASGNGSVADPASEKNGDVRTYRSKHGTTSQMDVSGIKEGNKKPDRFAIRKERDPDEQDEIAKQLKRSIPKAIKQAKRLGWTWDAFADECRKFWEEMPVAGE